MEAKLILDTRLDRFTPQLYLQSLVHLKTLSRCVGVALEYNIAKYVTSHGQPVRICDLAKQLGGFNEDNLRRFMSFLASNGIFKELQYEEFCETSIGGGDGVCFVGTELSDLLRDDVPGNVHDGLTWLTRRELDRSIDEIDFSLKSGMPSFELANGAPFYSYLTDNPGIQTLFDTAMSQSHNRVWAEAVELYDFGRYRNIVELCGGRGGFLKAILTKYPSVSTAVLFERRTALSNVLPELINDAALIPRFKAVAGDFLVGLPREIASADLYIIMQTMHNLNDENAMVILRNIANVMSKQSRLLIIDPDINDLTENQPAITTRSLDLLMMVTVGGKQRNLEMWRQLLGKCGLELTYHAHQPIIKLQPHYAAYECKLID